MMPCLDAAPLRRLAAQHRFDHRRVTGREIVRELRSELQPLEIPRAAFSRDEQRLVQGSLQGVSRRAGRGVVGGPRPTSSPDRTANPASMQAHAVVAGAGDEAQRCVDRQIFMP